MYKETCIQIAGLMTRLGVDVTNGADGEGDKMGLSAIFRMISARTIYELTNAERQSDESLIFGRSIMFLAIVWSLVDMIPDSKRSTLTQ